MNSEQARNGLGCPSIETNISQILLGFLGVHWESAESTGIPLGTVAEWKLLEKSEGCTEVQWILQLLPMICTRIFQSHLTSHTVNG